MHGKFEEEGVVWTEAIKAANNVKHRDRGDNHWAPLEKRDTSKVVYTQYRKVARALIAIAKHEEKRGMHMKLILDTTSDAEEQFALLTVYWKTKGLNWTRKNGRKYRFVKDDEAAKIIQMYRKGMAMAKIARELGRPVSTVYYVLKRNGLK